MLMTDLGLRLTRVASEARVKVFLSHLSGEWPKSKSILASLEWRVTQE